ncbi:MAG: transporter substrate-binding domain-containing protein [Synergistaceae bacterium]|jgi:signal transduction histidine kinase/CheY-like chemotaxis protein|nr:transporter substrate-binding domain-containing protein [Synergistaceae bacterium]
MRKLLCLLLASLILFLWGYSVFSPEKTPFSRYQSYKDIPGVTREEIESIELLLAGKPRLVYGVCESTESFLREDGSIGGFAELFGNRLSELFGFEFDYYLCSWKDMNEKIVSKEIDIVSDFTATPERLRKFLMTDAIIQRTVKVFTDMNGDSLSVTAKTRPIRCAFTKGSNTYSLVANSWNVPFEPVFIADQSEVPDMLLNGEIDAFIEEGPLEAAFDAYDFMQAEEYYPLIYSPISLTTGNPEMAPVIDVMQKYLKNGGHYELTDLYNQGYKDYLRHKLFKQLTDEEKEYIQKHRAEETAILAACETDNYPTSFYNKKENKFQGMALDTLDKISELTELVFQAGNAPNALWEELISGLESGKYSVISELIRIKQREDRFIWADQPYCTNNYALLSKAEYPDLDINQILFSKVGLIEGAAHTEVFLEWFPNSAKTAKYYKSSDVAFAALVKGEIDLLMASQNMLLNLTNYQEKPGFKANIVFKYSSDSYFGFNKDEEILRSIVNKTLRHANTGEITARWQRKVFNYNSKMIRDAFPFIILSIALLMTALFVVFVLFIKNRQMNKNLEKLVAEGTKELRDAIEAAKNADKAKSDFLSRMSHEMRTPLNTIIGMSELISHKDVPSGMLEYVSIIQQAGNNLLVIINDVLDFSKIEAGQMRIVPERYYFASVICDVVNLTRVRLLDRSLAFPVKVDGNIPEQLIGDEIRTKQILLNLLSNAAKYTYSGQISLDVGFEDAGSEDIRLKFIVGDSGVGIKREDIDRLFGDFVRIDNIGMREVEGTGLGLAITRSLCRAMGGEISVESEYGHGSTFTATIIQKRIANCDKKLASVDDAANRRVLIFEERPVYLDSLSYALDNLGVTAESVQNLPDFTEKFKAGVYDYAFVPSKYIADSVLYMGDVLSRTILVNMVEMDDISSYSDINSVTMPLFCINVANSLNGVRDDGVSTLKKHRLSFKAPEAKVLIVDDISTNLRVSKELMSLYGLEAHTCLSGPEAISLVRANRYDIIFMDHMMPGMNGVEAASIIRSIDRDSEYYRTLPIIALTANALSGQREMFLKSGMDDFLAKPIDLQRLDSVLRKWLPEEKRLNVKNDISDISEAAADHADMFEIPGVSVEAGLANSGGSIAAYLDVLDIFCSDAGEKAEQIERCAENGDLDMYMTLAHSLKGASRNIGATGFGDFAGRMEAAAEFEDAGMIARENGAFLDALSKLAKGIRKSLDHRAATGQTPQSEDLTQSQIETLRVALTGMDIAAANRLILEYSALPLNERARKILSDIENHVLMFDYDKAAETIDSFAGNIGEKPYR